MKSATYFILFVVYYCVHVESQQPTTPPSGTTTTTATPAYRRCYSSCQDRITKQYNPVCASNGQSFNNIRLLQCAQSCGLNAQYESPGTCGPSAGGK